MIHLPSVRAVVKTFLTEALTFLADQCRAINHAIDCAVWADDEPVDYEPTPTYDALYAEAIQLSADQQENLWGVAHFAAWEKEYFTRGADQ